MNLKALLLGAALGFLAAAIPSCGKTTCDTSSCASGCCDSNGKCQAAPANGANTSCGKRGETCVDCTQTSNKFCGQGNVCAATASGGGAGGGGGTGGGTHLLPDGGTVCNSANCATGCCAPGPTGLQCRQTGSNSQDGTHCGHTGEMCLSCLTDAGQGVCAAGFCKASLAPGQIGDSCVNDNDCSAIDITIGDGVPQCHKVQQQLLPNANDYTPGAVYPGGYCTRQCTIDAQCGDGICGYYGGQWGEALPICYSSCDIVGGTCARPEYLCIEINGKGACLPPNAADGGLDTYDAGVPPAGTTIGRDCTKNSDCQTETGYGECELGTAPDGGPSGFGTGQCVADCTMSTKDVWCQGSSDPTVDSDGGAFCFPIVQDSAKGPSINWQCVRGCSGDAGCKAGYHCSASDLYHEQTCEPDCDAPGAADNCGGGITCLNSLGCYPFECNTTTHDCNYK